MIVETIVLAFLLVHFVNFIYRQQQQHEIEFTDQLSREKRGRLPQEPKDMVTRLNNRNLHGTYDECVRRLPNHRAFYTIPSESSFYDRTWKGDAVYEIRDYNITLVYMKGHVIKCSKCLALVHKRGRCIVTREKNVCYPCYHHDRTLFMIKSYMMLITEIHFECPDINRTIQHLLWCVCASNELSTLTLSPKEPITPFLHEYYPLSCSFPHLSEPVFYESIEGTHYRWDLCHDCSRQITVVHFTSNWIYNALVNPYQIHVHPHVQLCTSSYRRSNKYKVAEFVSSREAIIFVTNYATSTLQ
jgi:hypothetical protein